MQGQEVNDMPDALLLLLNTAISWEPADSTVPPLATKDLSHTPGLECPPMAAPSPSRVPARRSQAETHTDRQHLKETLLYPSTSSTCLHVHLRDIFQGHPEHGAIQLHIILGGSVL